MSGKPTNGEIADSHNRIYGRGKVVKKEEQKKSTGITLRFNKEYTPAEIAEAHKTIVKKGK